MARVRPYGDSALLIDVDDVSSAHRVVAAIDRARRNGGGPAGIVETVVGLASVVVHVDAAADGAEHLERWLTELINDGAWEANPVEPGHAERKRHVDIPVSFDGQDLDAVAATVGGTTADVVDLLTGTELQVAFVGFAPGFPYLVGLPPELAAVPRRDTPRVAVPAGSVAVGGGFASVYPRATPGGWLLLGHTSVQLFDPDRPPYAFLRTGDTVRFTDLASVAAGDGPDGADGADGAGTRRVAPSLVTGPPGPDRTGTRPPIRALTGRFVEVLDPGLLSIIEDGGRRGVAAMGIPRAGPADPDAMRLANRLVGNPDGAATIEATTVGPVLRFTGHAYVAVVTPSPERQQVLVDGHPAVAGAVSPVQDGQVVTVGRVHGGLRAYVAVSGGFETPLVVGSRSTDLLSGLGPGPLARGDRLDLGRPSRPRGQLMEPLGPAPRRQPKVIRVIEGPHRLPPGARDLCASGPWTVGPASNRIGVRLTSPFRPSPPLEVRIPSTAMVTGAIQLPPDGDPIILLPDHATVGGYPVIACVIGADLPIVGQLEPGNTLEFVSVDRATARRERARRERALSERVTGWFPTTAGT
jgi:KipI family sensor histidine kinase inhibitor